MGYTSITCTEQSNHNLILIFHLTVELLSDDEMMLEINDTEYMNSDVYLFPTS